MYKILHIPTGFYLGVYDNKYMLISESNKHLYKGYQTSFRSEATCNHHLRLVFNFFRHQQGGTKPLRNLTLASDDGHIHYAVSEFLVIEEPEMSST